MEGQFDVLATHAAGVKQTIAASGCTKFYQAELDACHRLSNNGRIVLCLDDDDAGLKGMLILGRRFPNEPFDVCLLPSGYDPCDLRSERGDQVLTQALHRRVPIADLIVQRGSYQDAIQAIHHLHGHDQDRLIALLSEKSGQSENRIREQVSNVKPSHVATQPAAYKEHRRWVKAMSVPPDNHQKAKSITDRAQSSESYNLLAQLAAASYREGTDISQYRRIMPAALFQEDHKDEVMALDEHQSIDDLIAKARKTIWRKLDL
jgi:DNA primase